jgi:hypothetical protein
MNPKEPAYGRSFFVPRKGIMKTRDWFFFVAGILLAGFIFSCKHSAMERKVKQHDMHIKMMFSFIERNHPETVLD